MPRTQRWVFDRPLHRDWLFLAGLSVGLALVVVAGINRDHYGVAALVVSLVAAPLSGLLLVGASAGSVREYRRGRRPSA